MNKNIFKQNYSNKKILKINTLSPLNIGNGDVYTNLDYYIEGRKAKIIDIERMMENLEDIDKINQMQKLIKSNMGNNKLGISVKELYEGIGLYPDEYIKEIDCKIKEDASVQVEKFINQKGKYYIPGSSIKGAIRTAYIFDYYDKNFNELIDILKYNNEAIEYNNKIRRKELKGQYKRLKNIEHEINGLNHIFHNILITDSNIISPENFEFINTIRYNTKDAKTGKKSNTIPEPKETLKKGSEFTVELTIKKDFPKDFEEIKNMCNKFSKTIAEFETKNKYLPEETLKFYNNLLDSIKNDNNSFYLALGSGSSYLSKTIYLLLWKHDKENSKGYLNIIKKIFERERNSNLRKSWKSARHYLDFPRTRTIDANKKIPMGWVKITTK